MNKTIDFHRSVYELVTEYPELTELLSDLGFTEVKKPAALHSVGKLMTIPKGAKLKGIPMTDVITALTQKGFAIAGAMPADPSAPGRDGTHIYTDSSTEQLKGYLRRLGAGEDLERVRADFAQAFRDVDASEIMKAEQELMQEGTPLREVQKLCDLHSALFHGATRAERIANAEKAVEESLHGEHQPLLQRGQESVQAPGHGHRPGRVLLPPAQNRAHGAQHH